MVYFYAVPIVTNEIHEVKGIDIIPRKKVLKQTLLCHSEVHPR